MNNADPQSHDMHKGIASRCNNAAWDLVEKSNLSTEERVRLIELAGTAAYHWGVVGTAANIAHADVLFAWALARGGAAELAIDSARRALKYFTEHQSEDWERAFAYAAMAASLHRAGDHEGYRQHYKEAQQLRSKLAAVDLKLFEAAFRNVPRP